MTERKLTVFEYCALRTASKFCPTRIKNKNERKQKLKCFEERLPRNAKMADCFRCFLASLCSRSFVSSVVDYSAPQLKSKMVSGIIRKDNWTPPRFTIDKLAASSSPGEVLYASTVESISVRFLKGSRPFIASIDNKSKLEIVPCT